MSQPIKVDLQDISTETISAYYIGLYGSNLMCWSVCSAHARLYAPLTGSEKQPGDSIVLGGRGLVVGFFISQVKNCDV